MLNSRFDPAKGTTITYRRESDSESLVNNAEGELLDAGGSLAAFDNVADAGGGLELVAGLKPI